MLAMAAFLALGGCGDGSGDAADGPAEIAAAPEIVESAPSGELAPPEPAPEPAVAEPEPEAAPAEVPPAAAAAEPVAAPVAASRPAAEPLVPALATGDPVLGPEMAAMIDDADTVTGRTIAQRCAGCHMIDPTTQGIAAARIGPPLADVFGRLVASVEGFDYSEAMRALGETGMVWNEARLDAFLIDPAGAVPGTAMSTSGLSDARERADLIAFLRELSGNAGTRRTVEEVDLLERIANADPELGRQLSSRCSGCHRFGEGEPNLIGPGLFDVVGRAVGGVEGFNYSAALLELGAAGETWTFELLDRFLRSPATAIPGTRMGFAGVPHPDDRAAIIAFLRLQSDEPQPVLVAVEGVGVERDGLAPLAFTAAQAAAGAQSYLDLGCDQCHRPDLQGDLYLTLDSFDVAPPLTGPNFAEHWYRGSLRELFAYLEARKPRDNPGTLDGDTYAQLLAFILRQNGFAPGAEELPPDRELLGEIGFYQ